MLFHLRSRGRQGARGAYLVNRPLSEDVVACAGGVVWSSVHATTTSEDMVVRTMVSEDTATRQRSEGEPP